VAPRVNGGDVPWLVVSGAAHNNLRRIEVAFPLGRFTCVTGVSGSGKSSLVNDILHAALAHELNRAETHPGTFEHIAVVHNGASQAKSRRVPGAVDTDSLHGYLDRVIAIDQSPIGRTPRSNPATYVKLFDEIRELFARLPDSRLRGYKPGRFSFNVQSRGRAGGRCEACEGNGANRIEMDFLADVWVTCPVCEGRRFTRETLQIQYKGRSIADVLEMDVQQAFAHFENQPRIRGMLQTLLDVGLDYVKLGQPSTTLSGGEAQRIKLARELVKKATGRTLYVLDEPTTGLHFDDIRKLLAVMHGFVDSGNTVVVIEHNLDVVKTADWIIDLGPEGGAGGGDVVVAGTPEEVAEYAASYTGQALRSVLGATGAGCHGQAQLARAPIHSSSVLPCLRGESPPDLDTVTVTGARQHNLRDLTVTFPRNRITVCTGVSGSGKTSFAIDTVFTEGYRRYVESLSAYARQFLGQMAKPQVDHVSGLSPAICIEQKAPSKSPRSTVGTVTEVYDYMRVLWARLGTPHCPQCEQPVGSQTVDEIVGRILGLETGSPIIILAPVSLGDGETYAGLFQRLKRSGYARVRIDGQVQLAAQATTLDARRKHRVEIVVDRTVVRARSRGRIAESVEHALALGNGMMALLVEAVERVPHEADAADSPQSDAGAQLTPEREIRFSQKLACPRCRTSYEELNPHHFSFNSQLGWCPTCEGLGVQRGAPEHVLINRPERSLFAGAVTGWSRIDPRTPLGKLLLSLCAHLGVDPQAPLSDWTPAQRNALLFGTNGAWIDGSDAFPSGGRARGSKAGAGVRFSWQGFFPAIDTATRNSWQLRHRLRDIMADIPCVTCRGGRLRPEAAAVRLGGRTIAEICELPLSKCADFFEKLRLSERERRIAGEVLLEIRNRLRFLIEVGLDYLALHRAAPTLSGGEAQRIRLASQIGSGLSGVLYVLDEPTIGLHPRDNRRLVAALTRLRDLGNTLLIVEHDRDVIRSADRLLDFGPRAGRFGGRLVAQGTPAEFLRGAAEDGDGESLTRAYVAGKLAIPVPRNRRPVERDGWQRALRAQRDDSAAWLVVCGARHNNLKNIDVPIPLGRLVCVTGVSGSGKSSLVDDILWPALARDLHRANAVPGGHERIALTDDLAAVVNVDQAPLGATPTSNPATYTGIFDLVRELFARLPDSKVRGYNANRFSFNRPGGRCEACQGYGQRCIEMHFMPDVWVECDACHGRRYNAETLEVRFKGRTIAEVLELRVADALELFQNVPRIRRKLQTLADVGLDYVQLGQPAPTLSGGEAQRVKLAAELGRPDTGHTLYILDEPTTGLHFDDVGKLLNVLHRLVDLGNTVLVVEHNLDVLKAADWIIDLGPEAGDAGGYIVAMGTPEEIAAHAAPRTANSERDEPPLISHTAAALRPVLLAGPYVERARYDPAEHAARELAAAKAGLGDIGRDTKLPWQVDGRRWHLTQRSSRAERERHWEPAALEFVERSVQAVGPFAPTNWNERASVEITAPKAPQWFLHALTGGEWLLELYFRVPRGTFDWAELDEQLGLKTLDEREELPVYGDWARVDVRRRRDGPDAVVVYVHDKAEIDTPAFRRFVKQAAAAYFEMIREEDAGRAKCRGTRKRRAGAGGQR